MKTNALSGSKRPTVVTTLHQAQLASAIGFILLTAPFAIAAHHTAIAPLAPNQLSAGDIIRTDSGDAIRGGCILKVDAQTGQETVLSQGGHLGFRGYPMGVACDRNGQLIVANEESLLRIDPLTGNQTMIRNVSGAPGNLWSVALDRNDDILVAAETAILRVDPMTGDTKVVSSGGQLNNVVGIALGGKNELFATSVRYQAGTGWVGSIIRVNPRNGQQTIVADAGFLGFLLGITVQGDDIYVTGMQGDDQNFGIGQVVRVDANTGMQTLVSHGDGLVRPVGITMDESGQLIVADPYTINLESADLFGGALIRINPATGEQSLIARGHGSLVNPCGVAVVTSSSRGH